MTIKIEDINLDLLKKVFKIAKDEKISEKQAINEIIKKGIETKRKNKIPEYLIANRDTYNPNPTKKELNSIVGIIETPKRFDVVGVVNDVRVRKWK